MDRLKSGRRISSAGGKMRNFILTPMVILTILTPLFAQEFRYPVKDFYNRTIELPIDYQNPDAGTFYQYYQLASNFDFARPTLFFFQDIAQQYGMPGGVDGLAKEYDFFDHFNVVYYQVRGRQYSHIELKNPDGSVNWEKACGVLSSDRIIEDIERIRRDLFKDDPETKILLYGRSGGGFLIQRYLAKYSRFARRAFIRAAPNSIIMKQLGYPESRYFHGILTETDTTLYGKLKIVLKNDLVPDYQLFWILKTIPYASENPGAELSVLINDLAGGKKDVYRQYLAKNGFDFSKLIRDEKDMSPREIGMAFCPIEVSADYMLDPDPEYIDPFYACMKKLCEPYLRLIQKGKVSIPAFPPLETFKKVKTEVFYLAGRQDHVSDYHIGIELGKYFRNYELFIADDNHTMSIHKDCYALLQNTFFTHGIGSKELRNARTSAVCREWKQEASDF
jgi:pimeloyl-ACP methyl ester carboxylesterase